MLALLVLQSTSSMVLDSYQDLLRDHLVVTLFLTMLVGAGGNAGNQSAIKVIRGLVSHPSSFQLLFHQSRLQLIPAPPSTLPHITDSQVYPRDCNA